MFLHIKEVDGALETDRKNQDVFNRIDQINRVLTMLMATTFAQKMNPWLYKVINLKSNGGTDTDGIFGAPGTVMQSDPSPLGIVMFNQCTGADDVYYGERIINAIIQMNNKFDLKRKGYVGGASVGVDSWDIELL
jgi:hypothetical protein